MQTPEEVFITIGESAGKYNITVKQWLESFRIVNPYWNEKPRDEKITYINKLIEDSKTAKKEDCILFFEAIKQVVEKIN